MAIQGGGGGSYEQGTPQTLLPLEGAPLLHAARIPDEEVRQRTFRNSFFDQTAQDC